MRSIFLMFSHRPDEAEEELKRVSAADPLLAVVSMTLGQVYLYMGQAARALQPIEAALELAPDLGYAREQFVHAYIETPGAYQPPAHIAMACSALGLRDIALTWLERAYDERDPHLHGFDIRAPFFRFCTAIHASRR